jgi:acetolactate synthase-1/2/3 large subunit
VTGAEALIRTLIGAGLDVCFANPGTTEMPMVRALDDIPGVRAVLGCSKGSAPAPLTATPACPASLE